MEGHELHLFIFFHQIYVGFKFYITNLIVHRIALNWLIYQIHAIFILVTFIHHQLVLKSNRPNLTLVNNTQRYRRQCSHWTTKLLPPILLVNTAINDALY